VINLGETPYDFWMDSIGNSPHTVGLRLFEGILCLLFLFFKNARSGGFNPVAKPELINTPAKLAEFQWNKLFTEQGDRSFILCQTRFLWV